MYRSLGLCLPHCTDNEKGINVNYNSIPIHFNVYYDLMLFRTNQFSNNSFSVDYTIYMFAFSFIWFLKGVLYGPVTWALLWTPPALSCLYFPWFVEVFINPVCFNWVFIELTDIINHTWHDLIDPIWVFQWKSISDMTLQLLTGS